MSIITLPKAKKSFYTECHVAGRQYHDASEVWEQLKVGTKLHLVADPDNRYDKTAVAVCYQDPSNNEVTHFGYIPRTENSEIFNFLSMGWNDLFECRISKICTDCHYEHQLRIIISILKNKNS